MTLRLFPGGFFNVLRCYDFDDPVGISILLGHIGRGVSLNTLHQPERPAISFLLLFHIPSHSSTFHPAPSSIT